MREPKICGLAAIASVAISTLFVCAQSLPPNVVEANKLEQQAIQLYRAGKYSEAPPIAKQVVRQNLLMTLWPISDQTTVQIMLDFYDAADKTKNAPQVLADVRRDWLVKLRKEKGLLDAVRPSGAFIMW